MTFPPYGYYVFSLSKRQSSSASVPQRTIPEFRVLRKSNDLFKGKWKERLEEEILPSISAEPDGSAARRG